MSEGTLKNSLPRTIEPRRFAQQRAELSGVVNGNELKRLVDAQVEPSDVVATLQFDVDEQRHKVVTGLVDCVVHMQCQRCLNAVEIKLACRVSSAIVWDEEAASHLPATLDPWVVSEDTADLYYMIEDEILLNLPSVAFHEQNCVDPALLSVGSEDDDRSQRTEKSNPFQVLEQLKGKTKE